VTTHAAQIEQRLHLLVEILFAWSLGVRESSSGNKGEERTCHSGRQRSADFQVCRIAGFKTCERPSYPMRFESLRPADLEIGDTVGLETCATKRRLSIKQFMPA